MPVISKILFSILLLIIGFQRTGYAQKSTLIGHTTAEKILTSNNLLQIHSKRYQPDSSAINYLNEHTDSTSILVFFGSWCRESRKFLPGFIKSMSLISTDHIQITYLGVDAQKKVPELFLKKYNIKYIPTVIMLKGKKEIGRIIEAPDKPIEQALVEILKKENKF